MSKYNKHKQPIPQTKSKNPDVKRCFDQMVFNHYHSKGMQQFPQIFKREQ